MMQRLLTAPEVVEHRGIQTLFGGNIPGPPPAVERREVDDPGSYPGSSLENPRTSWDRIFEVEPGYAGKIVTPVNALQLAAVWRCTTLIAGAIARVPLLPYRRTTMGKELARDHYLWPLLTKQANPLMTAYRFKRQMQTWLCLWGNAFAEIEISGRGQVVGLWPWRPDRVRISGDALFNTNDPADPNQLTYTYTMADGTCVSLPGSHILHLRGLELNGIVGLSPIKSCRQSLGLAMAAEEYGARFFNNNGKPGGVLMAPGKLGPEARKNLRDSFEDIHRGLRGAHRIGILEEGLKYQDVGVPPEDMQFLQTRQFQAIDIARLFGVPPHKIAELSRATFSNIEHQSIEFVSDCLDDWFSNWTSEGESSLLSTRETMGDQQGLGAIELEFYIDRLMRGDMVARYTAYNIGRNGGWLSRNDIRDKENQNRIPDGDDYLTPLNMVPLDEPAGDSPDPEDPEPTEPDADDEPADPPAKKKKQTAPAAAEGE
jgi:HK97 family phage portal protein